MDLKMDRNMIKEERKEGETNELLAEVVGSSF